MTQLSEHAAFADHRLGSPQQSQQPAEDHVIRAVFLRGQGRPLVSGNVELVGGGRVVAVVERCTPGRDLPNALPQVLRTFTPAIRLTPEVRLPSRFAVMRKLVALQKRLSEEALARAGCCERRVLLVAERVVTEDIALLEEKRCRVIAKLAQTVTEHARRISLTPTPLMEMHTGDVRLALSLMMDGGQAVDAEQSLHLAERLIRPLGMTLTVTPPGPLESFPIRLD